jgi:hypothetical protein
MCKRQNETIRTVKREPQAVGITPTLTISGSSHMKFEWSHNGAPRTVWASSSPSSTFFLKQVRSDVRRILRRDGVLS